MKKRLSALFLALALCLGLAVPAFAADGGTSPKVSLRGPENSGIIMESTTKEYKTYTFTRSNDNTAIAYVPMPVIISDLPTSFVPQGVDIVVNGVKSEEDIILTAWFDQVNDLYRQKLFMMESDKDAYVAPMPENGMLYPLPTDGKTTATGNPTAAVLGFKAAQDGTVVLSSERLYQLLGENTLIRVSVGDNSWLFWLSGEPKLISDVFTDVETGNWVSDPVAWALMNDITTGTSETEFSPSINCTQAQILTFLYRAAREDQVESTAKDMELAVDWAREKGMIDDSFNGSTPCTRATAVNYIWQAFNKPAAGAPASFTDVDDNVSFAGAVSWAVEKKITNGANADGTMFLPDKICNRGVIVTFLYRAYNN